MEKKKIKEVENNENIVIKKEKALETEASLINEIKSQPDEFINTGEIERIIQSTNLDDSEQIDEIKADLDLNRRIEEINNYATNLKEEKIDEIENPNLYPETEEEKILFEKLELLQQAKNRLNYLKQDEESIRHLSYSMRHEEFQIIKESHDVSILETRAEILELEGEINKTLSKEEVLKYEDKLKNRKAKRILTLPTYSEKDQSNDAKITKFNNALEQIYKFIDTICPGKNIKEAYEIFESSNNSECRQQIKIIEDTFEDIKDNSPELMFRLANNTVDKFLKKELYVECIKSKTLDRNLLIKTIRDKGLLEDEDIKLGLELRTKKDKINSLFKLPTEEAVNILESDNSLYLNYENKYEFQDKIRNSLSNLFDKNAIDIAFEIINKLKSLSQKNKLEYTQCLPITYLFCTNQTSQFCNESTQERDIIQVDNILSHLINNNSKEVISDYKRIIKYLNSTGRDKILDIKNINLENFDNTYLHTISSDYDLETFLYHTDRDKNSYFKSLELNKDNTKTIFNLLCSTNCWQYIDLMEKENINSITKKLDAEIVEQQSMNTLFPWKLFNMKAYLQITNRKSLSEIHDLSLSKLDLDCLSTFRWPSEVISYLEITNRDINDIVHSPNFEKLITLEDFRNIIVKPEILKTLKPGPKSEAFEKLLFSSFNSFDDLTAYLFNSEININEYLKNANLEVFLLNEKVLNGFIANNSFINYLSVIMENENFPKIIQFIDKYICNAFNSESTYFSIHKFLDFCNYAAKTNRTNINEIINIPNNKLDELFLKQITFADQLDLYLRYTSRNRIDYYKSIKIDENNIQKMFTFFSDTNLWQDLLSNTDDKILNIIDNNINKLITTQNYSQNLNNLKKYLFATNRSNISNFPGINISKLIDSLPNLFCSLYEFKLFLEVTGSKFEDCIKQYNINENEKPSINMFFDNEEYMEKFLKHLSQKNLPQENTSLNDEKNKTQSTTLKDKILALLKIRKPKKEIVDITQPIEIQENINFDEEKKFASINNIKDCLIANKSPEKLPAIIFEKIKLFEKKYGQKGKGLVVLAVAAYGVDNPKNFCEEMENIENIIDKYNPDDIPEDAHVSLGFEYEVTKSLANEYNKSSILGYKNDINIISKYANIGIGRDAVHEIANNPTYNPYILLAEAKLMQDASLFDFNFIKYPQAARGYHLSLVGESGLKIDENAYFINNLLTMTNYTGVNAGKDVHQTKGIHSKSFFNVFEKGAKKGNGQRVEIKGMACDTIEQFEKSILTAHNAGIAMQITNKYLNTNLESLNFNNNFPNSADELETNLTTKGFLKTSFKTEKEKNILYSWLKLINGTKEAIANHNKNFIDSEFNGYIFEDNGNFIDTSASADVERNKKLISKEILDDPNFMIPLNIIERDLFNHQETRYVNTLARINNIFLKGPAFNANSSVNAGTALETMKNINTNEIMDGSPRKSIFETNGEVRDGYYYIQGASKEMIAHKSQALLTEFNKNMENILKQKDIILIKKEKEEVFA